MKTSILIIFCISLSKLYAQNHIPLDTIYANDTKNVALFFPEPVRQGITGSDNFVFTYNREKEQYFGLLQATPGNESNLLVINKNGAIFSYIVRYKEHLPTLNYFIPESKSIGNEKPKDSLENLETKEKSVVTNRDFYYQKFSAYLLDQPKKFGFLIDRKHHIKLSVENIVFDKEELYVVIKIENKSTLDYELNYLNFYVATRKKGKKKSLQNLNKEALFKYHEPSKVLENETVRMVFVLPKFSISKERVVILELDEKNGERNLKLKISHKTINNPN
ncbi:DUF4138 domain-containing protein [Subsaxibacter sp. CAU 1640]|uniref:DUF4138 domain-containing protein n=1 Tax=Subsaxibacter sp. CAU 1640 TaxID=2933271 RepID=UPI002006359D|nr:DUF4138 domain-containing protein [Subsaxibacter sp. CAU 1640]MCK7591329.1 DUF4138 domain-containing protein [Subsaxibacter sp. CAU 1640]